MLFAFLSVAAVRCRSVCFLKLLKKRLRASFFTIYLHIFEIGTLQLLRGGCSVYAAC